MCGITGWIDWQQVGKHKEVIVKKMAQTLAKRGPDASNVFSDHHAALGHTRLIVVDPAGGAQPMTKKAKEGNDFTIVYNGELYNTDYFEGISEKRLYLPISFRYGGTSYRLY